MNKTFNYSRRPTLNVPVGEIPLGSEWPVRVQSMTNTATDDVESSASQCQRIAYAGADYVLKDDPSSGGVNIDFEKMYNLAAKADYWRILYSFPGDFTYDALKASEPRNADFKAFKEKQIIYCNMKQSPYYERSPMEPDVVLKDFVYIFHPELLPEDYQPSFYKLLK